MAELVSVGRPTKKKTSSMKPDWTQLPEELLQVISEHLDNCFDVVHARSVCTPWRLAFPFPSSLIPPSYYLPTYPIEKVGLCNLEKIPLFLFRALAPAATSVSEYFVGKVARDDPVDYIERPSPLQCSVKVKIPRSDPTLMNMLDFQIIPLEHKYRIICWNPEGRRTAKRHVAFLPLSKKRGGEEFVVLCYYSETLLVLKSAERKWVRLKNVPGYACKGLVTFRGRFYANFDNRDVFVIDPYSLEATRLMPTPLLEVNNHIVQSRNDELFLVEKNVSIFRVSKLDEEAGGSRWLEVSS